MSRVMIKYGRNGKHSTLSILPGVPSSHTCAAAESRARFPPRLSLPASAFAPLYRRPLLGGGLAKLPRLADLPPRFTHA